MNLVKKIKDILFEEEDELTREVKIPEKQVNEPKIVKIESLKDNDFDIEEPARYQDTYKENKEQTKYSEPVQQKMPAKEVEPKRETFTRSDNTFKFPDFDEEEFANSMSRPKQNTNVLDYERKKKEEKREYSRFERVEVTKEIDKKKFKPSPIISPVYGILNQDYKAEDIVKREDVSSNINIDEVRKKAFEPKDTIKEDIKVEIDRPILKHEETIDEPVVTFFEEKGSTIEEEKKEYKSIDDLLEEAGTEISLEDTLEMPTTNNLDAIEEELEKIDEEDNASKEETPDDDLDNDLFELIDSMYDDREEV